MAAVRGLLDCDRDPGTPCGFEWSKWVPKKCQIFFWRADFVTAPEPTLDGDTVNASGGIGVYLICSGNFSSEP